MAKGINSWWTVNVWLFGIGIVLMLTGMVRGNVWALRAIDPMVFLVGFFTAIKSFGL